MGFSMPPRADLKWLAIDLDNTLAQSLWTSENPTSEIGDPIQANVDKLKAAVEAGWKVVIHTARSWEAFEAIEGWLNYHGIPFDKIQPGKILAAVYWDDRGGHESAPSWIPGKAHCASCTCTPKEAAA